MLRILALLLVVLAAARPVRADSGAVALLPLDADKALEIYGQPVASEIARALVAGEVNVVVVGPRMAVPEGARLIVDGKISSDKAGAVILTIRVRNPVDGTVLTTMSSTAQTLSNIDKAAAELSARVLPAVRERLTVVRNDPATKGNVIQVREPPVPAKPRSLLIAIKGTDLAFGQLRTALTAASTTWARAHKREVTKTEPVKLDRKAAPETLRASGSDLAIAFEIGEYEVDSYETVPLARATVRVRIVDPTGIVFDRVIVTDTVVGNARQPLDQLATKVANEVLAILRPHMLRKVPGWRPG